LFSEVHRARLRRTGALVALKKIIMHHEKDGVCSYPALHHPLEKTHIDSAKFPITALREIKLLKLLSHKNILRLEDMAIEHPTRQSE
jgi:serine/threonine-protein kinase BUR1